MTHFMKYHGGILDYRRKTYGVDDALIFNGAKHPRVRFTYAGKTLSLTVQSAHSNLGRSTLEMKKRDIRKLLGEPGKFEPDSFIQG